MKAIYASKLYKSSKYKDKIHSNINNPLNVELVKQLSEYLSDEAIEDLKHAEADAKNTEVDLRDSQPTKHGEGSVPEPANRNIRNMSNSDSENLEDSDTIEDDNLENEDLSEDDVADASETSKDTESTISESTQITEDSENIVISENFDIYTKIDEIKSLLNSTQDTASVNRILVKDNELWIYYSDNINLNNVMGPAIELLNSANYPLDFNRLARSDNAIVFEINIASVPIESAAHEN